MTDLTTLKRIVALLLSLAALAEHAGGRSPKVRIFMFGLLRRAAYAAVTLLDDRFDEDALRDAGWAPPGPEYVEEHVEPSDLVRLAVGLRLIAMVILHFWPTPSERPRTTNLRGFAGGRLSQGFRPVALIDVPVIDTS